jgi:hypothetical protein
MELKNGISLGYQLRPIRISRSGIVAKASRLINEFDGSPNYAFNYPRRVFAQIKGLLKDVRVFEYPNIIHRNGQYESRSSESLTYFQKYEWH